MRSTPEICTGKFIPIPCSQPSFNPPGITAAGLKRRAHCGLESLSGLARPRHEPVGDRQCRMCFRLVRFTHVNGALTRVLGNFCRKPLAMEFFSGFEPAKTKKLECSKNFLLCKHFVTSNLYNTQKFVGSVVFELLWYAANQSECKPQPSHQFING